MFCKKCGKELPDDFELCPSCGTRTAGKEEPHALVGCPYCGTVLDPPPKRKRKCPSCGQYVFVKTRPSDRQRVLVTEDEAKKIEAEWERTNWLDRWLRDLESLGVTREDFEKERSKRVGGKTGDRDTIWALFNRVALESMKAGRSGPYWSMAMFLEEEDRDFLTLRQQASKENLQEYERSGVVKNVEVLAAGNSCPSCAALNGRVFTIEEALQTMPILCRECTYKLRDDSARGWCRCVWLPNVR